MLTIPQVQKDAYNRQISDITRNIYIRGRTPTILLPPLFYSFGSFMIHKDLTPSSIIKLLSIIEPQEKINFINEMINLLIHTIITDPILLNIEGNIYQILHAIARLMQEQTFTPQQNIRETVSRFIEENGTFKISKGYFGWLSEYNVQRNDPEVRKLINESKISRQEVKYTEFMLKKKCIGYFYFREKREIRDITLERIGAALNRPERTDTFNLFDLLIQELIFVPKTDGMRVNPGFFICPEDNNPILVSLCLSSFFVPFLYSNLNNLICAQLAMYAYSTDKLIVNVTFMRICVKYCLNLLNDNNLFRQIVGYDITNPDNFNHIRDIWYIFHNSQLLYRFLILIPKFYKERYNKLTEYFQKICRITNMHSKCNSNLSQNKIIYTIRRRNRLGITSIGPGSVVHVSDSTWNNGRCVDINNSDCPWKSLPAIIRVLERSIMPGDGHVIWKCEYYDHPLGTRDTFRIRQSNLTEILSFSPLRDHLSNELNQYLIRERQKDGFANTHYVGSGGIARNVQLHASRLAVVKHITDQNEDIIEERIRSEVRIPRETLLELVSFPQYLKTLIESPLSKQIIIANIDNVEINEAIRDAIRYRPGTSVTKTFMQNSRNYELDENEITAFLQEFHSKLVPIPEATGPRLKVNTCAMCTEYISSTEDLDSVKLGCDHWVCTSCKTRLLAINYNRGDWLEVSKHKCCLCSKFINPMLIQGLNVKWWSPILFATEQSDGCITRNTDASDHITKWRFCAHPNCNLTPLFNAKANIGDCLIPDDDLPLKCPRHNISELRPCPTCGSSFVREAGCDLLTCCRYGSEGCWNKRWQGCDHSYKDSNGVVTTKLCGTIFCYWCLRSFGNGHIQANHDTGYEHIFGHSCEYKNRRELRQIESPGPGPASRDVGGRAAGGGPA